MPLFSDLHCVHQNVHMFYFHFPPRFNASNFLFHFKTFLLPSLVKIRSTYVLLEFLSYPVSSLESCFLLHPLPQLYTYCEMVIVSSGIGCIPVHFILLLSVTYHILLLYGLIYSNISCIVYSLLEL